MVGGAIVKHVAERAASFGLRVVVHDLTEERLLVLVVDADAAQAQSFVCLGDRLRLFAETMLEASGGGPRIDVHLY